MDAAVLDAAAALLVERGYSAMTVDEVAARAGVGKQTLYRRWPSKAAVVLHALTRQTVRDVPVPDTGSVREDVRLLLRTSFAVLRAGQGRVVASLMAQAQGDEAFATAFRAGFINPRRAVLTDLLRRGLARGELDAGLDTEFVADLIYGPMWYRLLNQHAPLDDAFADQLTEATLSGRRPLPAPQR